MDYYFEPLNELCGVLRLEQVACMSGSGSFKILMERFWVSQCLDGSSLRAWATRTHERHAEAK